MRENNHSYLIFMLALSVAAIAALVAELVFKLSGPTLQILQIADTAICFFFFVDFCLMFYRAENRAKYFFTWGWLDLISSIPMLDALRWGRAARLLRIIRVLRAIRSARVLAKFAFERRAQSTAMGAIFVAILLVALCAIAVLNFEAGAENANIKTAEDAMWWCVVTMATVGYGDKFPVTTEGRLVACVLMTAGVSLFAVFSGYLASWFLGATKPKEGESELAALRREVAELKELIRTKDGKP